MRASTPLFPTRSRSVILLLAVLLPLFALVPGPASGQTAGEDLSAIGRGALEEITACLQARPFLAVAIVVDESRSLRTTDPEGSRADILGQFMRRIASFAGDELDGRAREVYVNVGYFGSTYEDRFPWQQLDEQRAPAIVDAAIAETRQRDGALHTRHSFAIDGARAAIDTITARFPSRDLCTMVIWFSDGELDPDNNPRGAPDRPAILEATDELCRPSGLLDQLRSTGTTLVGIMLDSASIDRSGTPIPRKREMVEGDGPGGRCGIEPARGVYLEGELATLFRMFERVAAESEGGTRLGAFSGDPIEFPVDSGVGRLRIVGPAPEGLVLQSPSGRDLKAAPSGPLDGALRSDAIAVWTDGSVSLDVLVQRDYGTWRILRAGEQGGLDVYYFGDLVVEPDLEATRLLRGEPSRIVGAVTRIDGTPVTLADFASLSLTIDTGTGAQPAELASDGTFALAVDVGTEEAELPVRLRLDAVTERGVALQPVVRQVALPVTLPEEFPTVEFAGADRFAPALQALEDRAQLTVDIIGSPVGPTRVCIVGLAPSAERISVVLADGSADGCVDLAPDERRQIGIEATLRELSLDRAASEVVIEAQLTSAPIDGRGATDVTKVLRSGVDILPPPPNEWVRWLLLVLGILLPLIALIVANHRAARFSTRELQAARIPVTLEADETLVRLRRTDTPSAPLLENRDFSYLPVDADRSRSIDVAGATLRARTPINPFGSIRAEVVAPPGSRVVSDVAPATSADGRTAGMDLMPQRDSFLVISDTSLRGERDAPIEATLVTFLTPQLSGDRAQLDRVIDGIDGALIDPERLRVVRDAAAAPDAGGHAPRRDASAVAGGAAGAAVPTMSFDDGFGDGFDDGFGAPSPRPPSPPAAPPGPPTTSPVSDDAGWGSSTPGSDDGWD